VLLDTTLPGVDSVQLAEQITASPALAGALILMVSPSTQGIALERYREIIGATYLTKPLGLSELQEAVMLLLDPQPARHSRGHSA
jgi:DNA-binding response OmpR family regulator